MAAVLAAASYSRGGFNPCLDVSVRPVKVPGGSMFHLEPGTIISHTIWRVIPFSLSGQKPGQWGSFSQ